MLHRLLAVLAVVFALATPATAQPFTPGQREEVVRILREALIRDPSILREAITALQEDETKRADQAAQSAIAGLRNDLVRTPGDPVGGNPAGDVTVVEFYDIRCPYCRRMVPVIAELLRRDPGVRVVYKDMPVLGPASMLGARALLAAQKQGGYLKLHALLMTGTPTIDRDALRTAAGRAGLDWPRLERDMEAQDVTLRINNNLGVAQKLRIEGTPAYVIGGTLLPGAVDLASLEDAVALARKK